jgi:hypothetical protein
MKEEKALSISFLDNISVTLKINYMKSLKFTFFVALVGLLLTSCGKNYEYDKVITNNTRDAIQVQLNYDHDQTIYTIEPGESVVVFSCIYQFQKPKQNEVCFKFSKVGGTEQENLHLQASQNWSMLENGKQIKSIYSFEE